MPTFAGITIELRSQYDLMTIPEFAAPPTHPHHAAHERTISPPERSPDIRASNPNQPTTTTTASPPPRLASVYIPIYASSQFWICYSVDAPQPQSPLYYFKLRVCGAEVVSWGVGAEDGFSGRTVFVPYGGASDSLGRAVVEKRGLFFGGGGVGGCLEIRVFRCRQRKRVPREIERFRTSPFARVQAAESGIDLARAGNVKKNEPQRYYTYALLDAIDEPFAIFRYQYRTWGEIRAPGASAPNSPSNACTDQLNAMGIGLDDQYEEYAYEDAESQTLEDPPVPRDGEAGKPHITPPRVSSLANSPRRYDEDAKSQTLEDPPLPRDGETAKPHIAPPRVSSLANSPRRYDSAEARDLRETFTLMRRVSLPPPEKPVPQPTSPSEPGSPVEKGAETPAAGTVLREDEGEQGGAGAAVRAWLLGTPSPTRPGRHRRRRPTTPPSVGRQRGNSVGVLKGILANAMRRRGESP
ncbi:hypothetical protein LTR66_014048 [Elasticomyces elasticus]|nr:hypothetical protein LTR66_014048 [Elasticomyces elasticus]